MKKLITYILLAGVCLLLVVMQASAQSTTICVESYNLGISDPVSGHTYYASDRVENSSGTYFSSWHPLPQVYLGSNQISSYCHQNCYDSVASVTYWVTVKVVRDDNQTKYGSSGSQLPDKNLWLNPVSIRVIF